MAAVLALAVVPAAGAAPSIFPLSDPDGRLDSPASIAAGPDQTMWIANAGPLHAAARRASPWVASTSPATTASIAPRARPSGSR